MCALYRPELESDPGYCNSVADQNTFPGNEGRTEDVQNLPGGILIECGGDQATVRDNNLRNIGIG